MSDRIKTDVEDRMISVLHLMRICATYIHFAVFKMFFEECAVASSGGNVGRGNWNRKDSGILHLDGHVMHGSEMENISLMTEATDFFIENITKATTFPILSAYKAAKLMLMDLKKPNT